MPLSPSSCSCSKMLYCFVQFTRLIAPVFKDHKQTFVLSFCFKGVFIGPRRAGLLAGPAAGREPGARLPGVSPRAKNDTHARPGRSLGLDFGLQHQVLGRQEGGPLGQCQGPRIEGSGGYFVTSSSFRETLAAAPLALDGDSGGLRCGSMHNK